MSDDQEIDIMNQLSELYASAKEVNQCASICKILPTKSNPNPPSPDPQETLTDSDKDCLSKIPKTPP